MKIITNNVPRLMKYGYEMPENLRADFEYIDTDEFNLHDFVVYKGQWYDLSELIRLENIAEFEGWHGCSSDNYFSGILIKIVDNDRVIIGQYFS